MLSNVLLTHLLRAALILVGLSTAGAYFILGESAALGVLVGGLLTSALGAGQIWFVGKLLGSDTPSGQKAGLGFLLFLKLFAAGGILWLCLSIWQISGLGMIIGMAAGLGALMIGAQSGAASKEGLAAIAHAEERIAEEMGDKQEESR